MLTKYNLIKMTSSGIKLQLDYIITMDLIKRMLDKVTPTPTPGSILIGKQYATKYHDTITKMLSNEFVDIEILKDARVTVKQDLELIIEDSNRRFFSHHIKENQHMMSMILDFILSL